MVTKSMSFKSVKEAFQENVKQLIQSTEYLFVTDISKDELWDAYLNSFPEDMRQGYNCNSCRQLIKQYGNVVAIDSDYQVRSFWKMQVADEAYQEVFNHLDERVTSANIRDAFITDTPKLGTDSNLQLTESGETIRWHHLSFQLPRKFVTTGSGDTLATLRSERRSQKDVLKRSLDELTVESTQTVLELISSNSIYRGQEFKGLLEQFLQLQREYAELTKQVKLRCSRLIFERACDLEDLEPIVRVRDNYCWLVAAKVSGSLSKIRNSALGTLLIDLSAGLDINEAVGRFERVMAPANYKRPTPVFTKRMVEEAENKIAQLGLTESLPRRHATLHDLTVNNLLFVDRSARVQTASIFEGLKEDVLVNPRKFDKVQSVSLEDFIRDVLPLAHSVELLVENKHQSNLVSLIAPVNPDSPSLFKWANGFSWSYSGAFADSVKERVKKAGGEVEGRLRISLAWSNYDDLDLHLGEPSGERIYFSHKWSQSGGQLDIDMNAGHGTTREPVENIYYPHGRDLPVGCYKVVVDQYSQRERVDIGFTVEVEFEGNIQTFEYLGELRTKESVDVLTFRYDRHNGFKVLESIEESGKVRSKEFWGLRSNQFHKVNALMFSPNYWEGERCIGNKHLFVLLDKCRNDEAKVRGFFNEFLKDEFTPHRKVFEALADKMQVANNVGENQLSGVGFSLTQSADFVVKVKGKTERVLKVVV